MSHLVNPFYLFFFFKQNLRKHCEVNDILQEAHVIMKDVARNIDQVKRQLEQSSRVKELSGILDGWLGPGIILFFLY